MDGNGRWTIDELVARVAAELGAGYAGAPSGRVRDVPDRRAIRWYTTIGLVDRPLEMRGRTALYGLRHLLQLVAVKRLQATGRTLAEIQAELAGATDRTLGDIAGLSLEDVEPSQEAAGVAGHRAGADGKSPPVRARFWASPASAPPATSDLPTSEPPICQKTASEGTASGKGDLPVLAGSGEVAGGAEVAVAGRAVVLGGGVTVVLAGVGRELSGEDLAVVGAAARPLLEVLGRRGLLAVELAVGSGLEAGAGSRDGERSGGS